MNIVTKHPLTFSTSLLIVITLSYAPVLGQTQESSSKNTMITVTNSSFVKDALDSVHNETIPHYVKLSENEINQALVGLPSWTVLDGKLHKKPSNLLIFLHCLNSCIK